MKNGTGVKMSLMDVLRPQHYKITQPVKLIRPGLKNKILSAEQSYINQKLSDIESQLFMLYRKKENCRRAIHKIKKNNLNDKRIKIFERLKLTYDKEMAALKVARFNLDYKNR